MNRVGTSPRNLSNKHLCPRLFAESQLNLRLHTAPTAAQGEARMIVFSLPLPTTDLAHPYGMDPHWHTKQSVPSSRAHSFAAPRLYKRELGCRPCIQDGCIHLRNLKRASIIKPVSRVFQAICTRSV